MREKLLVCTKTYIQAIIKVDAFLGRGKATRLLCSALYFFGSKIDKHDPAFHCFHYKDNIILLYVHNVTTSQLSLSLSLKALAKQTI